MEADRTIARDLVAALVGTADFSLEQLPGGGNNRVFRVRFAGKVALLKEYFHHPGDPRDRLDAEFSFSKFAWDAGLRCLPEPLGADPSNHLGLYEFIEGRPVSKVTREDVQQALDFFCELNRRKDAAQGLPVASEACFSIAEHLQCVEWRVQRLAGVEDPVAARFVRDELTPQWRAIAGRAYDETPVERCVSPSDFGFHNALQEPPGRLRFIDFEYAGWDDPAKMVCDFFCQPARPVPHEFLEMFAAVVDPQRVARLLPVYQVKWCCIILNDFLPVESQRRQFSRSGTDKTRQLEKAKRMLKEVSS
jgi:hypothetical protein